MTLYQFLYLGFEVFATFFVLGVASIVLEAEDEDDDDDGGGGILQPAFVTNN